MANFSVQGLDDLMTGLDSLEIDKIAPIMLEETVPILEKNVKNRAEIHKDTGEMITSIKPTKPKRTGEGYSITVRPTGKDKKGIRNMEKACYLEFGTSKQKADPIISPAVRESEDDVAEKMQEVFDREVERIDNL